MSLYLVQALYGSQAGTPMVPRVECDDAAVKVSTPIKTEVVEEVMGNCTESPPLAMTAQMTACVAKLQSTASCVEKFNASAPVKVDPAHQELDDALAALKAVYEARYKQSVQPQVGANPAAPPVTLDHVHPARQQQLLEPELVSVEAEGDKEQDRLWVPTGSNVLPLGVQETRKTAPPTAATPSKASQRSSEVSEPCRPSTALATCHLPPAGGFYDQINLQRIFGDEGLWKKKKEVKCGTCWTVKHAGSENCKNVCPICGTKKHPGKTCPLLYCSVKWYKSRKVPVPSDRQIRPDGHNLLKLIELGMVKPSSSATTRIEVNKAHLDVRGFYSGKWPQTLSERPLTTTSSPKNVLGHAQRLAAPTTPTAGAEEHLQKLEEEVLRLKLDNIVKDREIRALKTELEQMRGTERALQTGSKRARLDGDDTVLSAVHFAACL